MACITERKRVSGESKWQAVVRIKGHPPIVHTFDTREQAEKFSAEVESAQRKQNKSASFALQKLKRAQPARVVFHQRLLKDILKDYAYGPVDPETGKRPGEELATTPKVANQKGPRPKRRRTPEQFKSLGTLWGHFKTVLDNVGGVALGDAKGAWVLNYIDKMSRKMSSYGRPYTINTINKHLRLMKSACEEAATRADIEDPQFHFTMKHSKRKKEPGRERRLEPGEHEKIMGSLRKTGLRKDVQKKRQWRCLYRLALETGARLQELVLADWTEFSFEGVWTIPADNTKKTKTRMVSLSPRARRVIQILRAMAPKNSKYVFHSFGTVLSVSNGWAYRMQCAGIAGLTFHDLRHEATTRMVTHPNGIRMETIQKMVGHESADMTAKYTHLRPADFVGLFDKPARPV